MRSQIQESPAPNDTVLNSWKEIAQYMGRAVRTVQRWERTLRLPVRRPHGKQRSAVLALKSDIDLWLQRQPSGRAVHTREALESMRNAAHTLHQNMLTLVAKNERLQHELARTLALSIALEKNHRRSGKKQPVEAHPARPDVVKPSPPLPVDNSLRNEPASSAIR